MKWMEEYSIALKTDLNQDPEKKVILILIRMQSMWTILILLCMENRTKTFSMRLCVLVHILVTVESPGLAQGQEKSRYSRNIT